MSNYKYTVILFASIDNWGYSINLRHAGTMQAGIDWSKICITLTVCSTYIYIIDLLSCKSGLVRAAVLRRDGYMHSFYEVILCK